MLGSTNALAQMCFPAPRSQACRVNIGGNGEWTPALSLFSGLYLLTHLDPALPQVISNIYSEMKCLQLGEVPAKGLNIRSRIHKDPLRYFKEVLY